MIAHGRRSRPDRPGAIILIILLYGELHEDAADSHRITAIGGRIVEDGRALALEFAAFAGVQASKFLDDAVTGAAIAATAITTAATAIAGTAIATAATTNATDRSNSAADCSNSAANDATETTGLAGNGHTDKCEN